MSTHELFRAHLERLHRLAWRLLGGDEQGAREVLHRAAAHAQRERDAVSLTRIVVHEAAKHRRRSLQKPTDPTLRKIHDAVEGLTDGQREAFVLVHLEGHSVVEAAALLDENETTAQSDLRDGFERLRTSLHDLNENDRDLLETIRTLYRPEPIASWEPVRSSRRHALALALTVAVAFLVWSRPIEDDVAVVSAPPSEEVVLHTLRGSVTTLSGANVAGAVVTAGGAAVETETDGTFAIHDLPARAVQVTGHAPGLSTAEARVDPTRPVTLQLVPVTGRGTIDAAAGGQVADKEGFSLVVPPDSFPGTVGSIDVEWAVLRDAGSLGAAPSPLATEHDLLESFGMVEVRFAQNGASVEFRGTADLTWPLAAHAPSHEDAGPYSYDPDAGVWREEGEGTVKKGRMHAQVTHFSWWSYARPIAERGCVAGRLDGPLSSTIYLEGDDYLARVATTPGQDGKFCLDAMPARSARVFSRSRVGDRCYVSSQRVVASAAGTSCAIDRSQCADVHLWSTEVGCPQPTPWRGDRRERN